ncbi:hypothetical protein DSO57_1006077 [Entomophthora muscae]|uniref:Uncharacterized protein n=1 Tax=Entomophthora muscae TaxID=34485 RepID=A0ACC2SX59_9FUNG|nr:hypothetical protein DSO57_1006077 [Entomophthora muscae]
MEAPSTLKPDCLPPSPDLSPLADSQYAGIAYMTLAGLVNTMVPSTRPWALVGQSASYLIKLASLLWWAHPSSQQSKLAAKANRTPLGCGILTYGLKGAAPSKAQAGDRGQQSHQAQDPDLVDLSGSEVGLGC